MKIAINIYPLNSAHKNRGIGFYTKNLIEYLKKDPEVEIQEFLHSSDIKQADIIHYPWFDFFFHSLPLKKKAPTVVTIHDVTPLIFKENNPIGLKGKFNFYLQKMALKNCKAIITDSNTSKNDIEKYLKIKKEKIFAIPLATDKSFRVLKDTQLIHLQKKYNLPPQYLLYVGDANWVKNLTFLIEGFYKIIQYKGFENLKLILVGGIFLKKVDEIDHPELESLKKLNKLIRELNLENKIIRSGRLDEEELVGFYNLATLYIQPSLYEGFGLPVLEALACGVPVVSSNGGSLKEVGGNAAIYFNPLDLDKFSKIVTQLLSDRSLQSKLSTMGLNQAKKFSWDKVAADTKAVYENILK